MPAIPTKDAVKRRVLLVDDEPEIPNGLMLVLRGLPYVFFSANSGAQALDILERVPIDVVVSDEKMPGMSGNELLAQVRNRYPNVVRIMLSGQVSVQTAMSAIHDGCVFQYLHKPCNPADLAACIHNALLLQSFLLPDERLAMPASDQETLIASVAAKQDDHRTSCSAPPWRLDSDSPSNIG